MSLAVCFPEILRFMLSCHVARLQAKGERKREGDLFIGCASSLRASALRQRFPAQTSGACDAVCEPSSSAAALVSSSDSVTPQSRVSLRSPDREEDSRRRVERSGSRTPLQMLVSGSRPCLLASRRTTCSLVPVITRSHYHAMLAASAGVLTSSCLRKAIERSKRGI